MESSERLLSLLREIHSKLSLMVPIPTSHKRKITYDIPCRNILFFFFFFVEGQDTFGVRTPRPVRDSKYGIFQAQSIPLTGLVHQYLLYEESKARDLETRSCQ